MRVNKLDITIISLIFLLSFIYFHKIIFSTNKILIHGDYRYGLIVQQHIQYHLNQIFVHAPKFLVFAVLYLFKIAFGDILAEKLFTVFILFLSATFVYFSDKYFLKRIFEKTSWKLILSAFVGCLVFLYNPWTINKIHHHYWEVLSLASSYLLLAEIDRFIYDNEFPFLRILSILGLIVLIATQIQGLIIYAGFMIIMYVLCFIIFEKKTFLEKIFNRRLGLSLLILILLNSFWIVPQLETLLSGVSKPGSYGIVAENVNTLSRRCSIINILRCSNGFLWGSHYTVIYNLYIVNFDIWKILSLFPFLLAVIPLLFLRSIDRKNRRYMLYFSILLVLSILLSTGSYYPVFGNLYRYAFLHFPLGWVIRDPYKNTGLVIVCLSFLISVLSALILNYDRSRNHLTGRFVRILALSFVVLSIVIWGWPALTGDLNGHLKHCLFKYPKDLEKTIDYLKTHMSYRYNVLWYPVKIDSVYLAYEDVPQISSIGSGLNTIVFQNEELSKYVENILRNEDRRDLNNLFDKLAIKYLVLRHDVIKSNQKRRLLSDVSAFEKIFNDSKVITFGNFTIYKIRNADQVIDAISTIAYATSPNLYKIFIFNNTVTYIYPVEFYAISDSMTQSSFGKYLIKIKCYHYYPKKYWSLGSFVGGWLKRFVPYLEKYDVKNWQLDYSYGLVFTWAKNTNLAIPLRVSKSDDYKLFIRYFENQKGGEIRVYLDGKPIEIKTEDQLNKFVWKDLGTFHLEAGEHKITLQNVYGFNAVNLFALIPVKEYIKAQKEVKKLLQNKTVIYLFEAESDLYRENATIINDINASNGEQLLLYGNGVAWQNLTIVKNGTYRLALRGTGDFVVTLGHHTFTLNSTKLGFVYTPLFNLGSGKYRLEIKPLKTGNLVRNPSFEVTEDGQPVGWHAGNEHFTVSLDKGYAGKYSLKVSTTSTKADTWSWIRSEPISVKPGKYLVVTHMKTYNVKASHIKIEAYYPAKHRWAQLLPFVPSGTSGTHDWTEYSKIITVPENVTKIRIVLNAGWVLDKNKGKAITWFDDIEVVPLKKAPKLDVIWLYSTNTNKTVQQLFEVKEKSAKVISYQKINPTLWKVKVQAKKPFMLSFAEAYDPLWEVKVYKDGKLVEKVKSIPLYSVINGFWINETGNLTIVIRYLPQDWFELGLKISAATFTGCIGFLIYDWRRERGDRWAKKIETKVKDLLRTLRQR